MTHTTIHVQTVLGDVQGLNAEEGEKIYDLILEAFFQSKKVILSFDSMEVLSEQFLEAAIGKLYKNYSHAEIKENMLIENIPFTGKLALKRVVDKAIKSY